MTGEGFTGVGLQTAVGIQRIDANTNRRQTSTQESTYLHQSESLPDLESLSGLGIQIRMTFKI